MAEHKEVPEEVRRLAEAVLTRDRAATRGILRAAPDLIEVKPPDDLRPQAPAGGGWLHLAVASGDLDILEELIVRGAPLDLRDAAGRQALHDALESGLLGLEDALIESGAEVDVCSAALLGDLERLESLLAEDAGLAGDRRTGLSPLGWAAFGEQPAAALRLIEAGARPADGELFCCAQVGHAGVAEVLLDRGADPCSIHEGSSVLHVAVRMLFTDRGSDLVRLLLERGADADVRDGAGRTPLALARELSQEQQRALDAGEPLDWERDYAAVIAALESRAMG